MKTTSEILLNTFLDSAPIGILIFDEELRITFLNESFFSFGISTAFTKDELYGKSILNEQKIGLGSLAKQFQNLIKGDGFEVELSKTRATNGSAIKIIVKGVPIFEENKFKGGVIIIEDIKSISSPEEQKYDYQSLLETLSPIADIIFITNMRGEVIYNSSSHRIKIKKEIKFVRELFEKDCEKALDNLYEKAKQNIVEKKEINLPLSKLYDNNFVNVKVIPISGNNTTTLVLIKDVTKELEEKIAFESELNELRRYQAITSSIVDAVIGINFKGEIRFWNESSEKTFNYTKSQVFGKFIDIIFPSLNGDYFQILRDELLEKKHWEGELTVDKGEDNKEFYDVRMGITGEGDKQSIVILCSSVTERYNLEKELRQSEERFRNIVTNSHEYICTIDLNGRIQYVNPYFVKTFGYSDEELSNKYFSDLVDIEYLQENEFTISPKNLDSMQARELPLVKSNGEVIFVLASFASVHDLENKPKYYIAVLTDITQKKQAEKDLLLIKTVFEASQDGIAVTVNGTIILVNNSFSSMLGYNSEEDLVGSNFYKLIDPTVREEIQENFVEIETGAAESSRMEFDLIKKDGSKLPVANSIAKYGVDESMFLVSVLRDVTVEKSSREALRASEERYRSITENIEESLWTAEEKDGKLKVVLYTQAIKDITGFTVDEFLTDEKLWMKIIHPDDAESILTKINRLYSDPGRTSEAFEYRIISNSGSIVWIENKINIIRKDKGRIHRIYGLVSDISYKKKAEEELKNSAENLKKLNEAKDRFLSIISHDLRTPFSSIIGFTDYLLGEQNVSEEKQRNYIKLIQDSSKSMLSLVNSLLDWTRIQTGRIKFEPERINVREVVKKSFNMLSGTALQKKIEMNLNVEEDVFVHADSTLLLQVFNNLISNAIKFTNDGGNISISAEPVVEKRAFQFHVKDNGVGIKESDIDKLFNVDSKFTTPGTSGEKGSGLGLSLVKEIIEKHGGEISVKSILGDGTEFIFTIPVSSMNILLVDDTKTDRLLYSKLIRNFLPSYTIIEASNGEEALKSIIESPPAIVITDHYMPEMSGYELVKQIKILDVKFKPPVIVLSSDITLAISEEYAELGVEFVFQKPVNLKSFKEALEISLKKAIYS